MLALGGACTKSDGLTSLRSFTLTTRPQNSTDAWMDGTELLLRGSSSLEIFQIYIPNSGSMAALADNFFIRVIDQHRDHLVRFSFHRLCISLDIIDHVCTNCPRLEELFLVIHHAKMVHLSVPSAYAQIHMGIIRHPFYRYSHRQGISAQCTFKLSTDRICAIPSSTRWISFASVVQRFVRLESKQTFGR
jgi:hypothetical protein